MFLNFEGENIYYTYRLQFFNIVKGGPRSILNHPYCNTNYLQLGVIWHKFEISTQERAGNTGFLLKKLNKLMLFYFEGKPFQWFNKETRVSTILEIQKLSWAPHYTECP